MSQHGDSTGLRVVLITHPEDGAEAFARRLVEERLAACVNVHPVHSVFRWEGRVEEQRERALVVKTHVANRTALEAFLASEHPYDCPECIALAPRGVEPGYRDWWLAEVVPAEAE